MILPREYDSYLTIPFDSPNAPWALLVIDDMWDGVKEMIFGFFDRATNKRYDGIGEQYLNIDAVKKHWENRYPGQDEYERALWFLPWAVAGIEDCAGITFCPFPDRIEQLTRILKVAEQAGQENPAIFRRVAVLCDVNNLMLPEERHTESFLKTWDFLDRLGHPVFARKKFTRGGRSTGIPGIAIPKDTEDPEVFRRRVREWLICVRGGIDPALFAKKTPPLSVPDPNDRRCHHPSELPEAKWDTRKRICGLLTQDDTYGVWRWCADLAALENLPAKAQHRWLAGKAFQTTAPSSQSVAVTALVAICEGARKIVSVQDWHYDVESSLYEIPVDEVDVPHGKRRIDKPGELGNISLSAGVYGDFAVALRDWLIHTEHFEPGKYRLQRIQIVTDRSGNEAHVRLQYSNKLPEEVIRPKFRIGGIYVTWMHLSTFAFDSKDYDNELILTFSYKG